MITGAGLASGSFGAAKVSWVQCDVTDAAQAEAAVEETLQRCGRIDVLVNNAGICKPPSPPHFSPHPHPHTHMHVACEDSSIF